MESLLTWAISNSDGQGPPVERRNLDPGIIDAILGKSDAERMKDAMVVAVDPKQSEADRVTALDEMEMLVESIDNANNLKVLNMWEPLQSLLDSTSGIAMQALWVLGTALQNNPAAQDIYLTLNPLPTLTSFLDPSSSKSAQMRSKALYALSGLLKHNAPACQTLEECDGWEKLGAALEDPDITVRRKTAFLLGTLLHPSLITPETSNLSNMQTPNSALAPHPNSHSANLINPRRTVTSPITIAAVEKYGIASIMVRCLTKPQPYGEDGEHEGPDEDFEEKGVSFLRTYMIECNGKLTETDKAAIKALLTEKVDEDGKWGLSQKERQELVKRVS